MVRVLIVAPYASVRAGLHVLLADTSDFALVGEARGSADLERLLPQARPDVVLCDDQDEDRGRVLAALSGGVGLVLLCDQDRAPPALGTSHLPGWAVLGKEADGEQVAAAVRAVAVGLIVHDQRLLSLVSAGHHARTAQDPIAPGEGLTGREREVLQLMALGLPNKQIATRLGISAHTVKFHVAAILAKSGASSRTEAVTLGARRGDVLL